MQSKASTIATYLAELPPPQHTVIESLDRLVRSTLPGAIGGMKYGMPTYEAAGRLVSFNAQKNYFSFYADPEFVRRHRKELGALDTGKSCIRFQKLEPGLLATLGKIVAEYRK
jgi:uncharacterized protein YdhG (YjbR/CyaY superfamily)